MQQRRIAGYYPTLSGEALRVPSDSPARNTLAGSSKPRASRNGKKADEREHDSADEGFICDDEEHDETGTEQRARDLSDGESVGDSQDEYVAAIEAASRRRKRKMDEQRADEERALAAEVRALRLATAEARVQQRAAELEALEARVASFKEAGFGDKVQAARDHAAVAKAREVLAKAKLQALQLK
jgi:hypothetical protein